MKPAPVRRTAVLAAAGLAGALLAASPAPAADVTQGHPDAVVDWTHGEVHAIGDGAWSDRQDAGPASAAEGSSHVRRLMARRAAVADGYRKLAALVAEVRVDATATVAVAAAGSDLVRFHVDRLVREAAVGDPLPLANGTTEVELTADLRGPHGLTRAVGAAVRSPSAPPGEEPAAVDEAFTGLVVDARGLGLQPAVRPALRDARGGELYPGPVPPDEARTDEQGFVVYASDPRDPAVAERAGAHPLVLRALGVTGPQRTDPVLGTAAAAEVLGADRAHPFLAVPAVVFLR